MPWDCCSAGFGKRVSDYSVTLAANTNWHDLADIRLVQYGGGVGDFSLGEGSATMVLLRQLLGDVCVGCACGRVARCARFPPRRAFPWATCRRSSGDRRKP